MAGTRSDLASAAACAPGPADTSCRAFVDNDRANGIREEVLQSFGDYELLEEIARGGMGVVYRARQKSLGRLVAVKLILAGPFAGRQIAQRFKSEAIAAAVLQHPNIVAVHEVGVHDGQHFFSMDYVEGRNLADLVGHRPLRTREAARYVMLIADAIHYAHGQGILHRDLKPSNVLIETATDQPRVTDFGLAKRLNEESSLTLSGQVLGSPHFMPPEQASAGRGKIGRTSDVFGLGGILYFLLTARAPFQGETLETTIEQVLNGQPVSPRLLNPVLPRDLETICLKCLEKAPERRYETARELADELGRFLRDEPILARPVSQVEKAWRWCRRRPLVAGLSATTLALLLSVAVGSPIALYQINQQRQKAETAREENRRFAYAAGMSAAFQARQENNLERAIDLLNRQRPKPGEEDLRGFEWRHLWLLCQSDERATLHSASHPVHRAVLAPHGQFLVTASDRWLRLMDLETKQIIATLGGPEEFDSFIDIGAVAFSRDGRYLAAKGGRAIRVWRAGQWQTPCQRMEGLGNHSMNSAVAFSPDSRTLATRVKGGIGFWDTETWEMRLFPGPERLGLMMKYSRDGAMLAMDLLNHTNNSANLQIRDAKTLALITNLVRHPSPTTNDGTANSSSSKAASPAGADLGEERGGSHQDVIFIRVLAVDFSDRFLAAGHRDGELKLFDLATWSEVVSISAHPSFLFGLAFSPDGRLLATAGTDQVIKIWDVTGLAASVGAPAPRPVKELRGHRASIFALVFLPDGKNLLSASADGTVKIWDPLGANPPDGLPNEFKAVWFSPDARQLIAATEIEGGKLSLWNTTTRLKLEPLVPATDAPGYAVGTVSDDGQLAALGAADGMIDLWNLESRVRQVRIEAGIDLSTHQLAFSADGAWLAAAPAMLHHSSSEGGLRLWHLKSETPRPKFFRHAFAPLAFCSDGRRLVAVKKDGIIQVADFQSEMPLAQWMGHAGPIHSLALSPDNRLLATGAEDAVVRVWDLASRAQLLEFKGHLTGIPAMAFAPDGRTLVTVSWDSTIKFWHLATGRELFTFDRFRRIGFSARFSPNGEYLAVTGDNGRGQRELMLWRAPSWEEIATEQREKETAVHPGTHAWQPYHPFTRGKLSDVELPKR